MYKNVNVINETNLRLADMRELPALEGDYEEPTTSKPKSPIKFDLEKNFDEVALETIKNMGYPRPNDFFGFDTERIEKIFDEVKNDIGSFTGHIVGLNKKKHKTKADEEEIKRFKMQKDLLYNYKKVIDLYLKSIEYKIGQGLTQRGQGNVYFNNPNNLLKRLELLAASILAGNNGVIPEFSQIAHLLNQMKVISKKQLNDLLKTYITIR